MTTKGAVGLALRFQPQFDLNTKEIVGSEALTTNVGNPEEFFRQAEISGAIHELGLSVVRQAAKQIEKWRCKGIDPRKTFINVSHHQIKDGFCGNVIDILREYQVDADMLGMEFTEYIDCNTLTPEQETEIMRLKASGFELAIDDFGMGCTSLYSLELGVFDKLKIDKKFMRMVHEHGPSYKIVSMLAKLASELNIDIIAEGIEYENQVTALKEAGIYFAQGNLLCQPLPPDQIDILFSAPTQYKTTVLCS